MLLLPDETRRVDPPRISGVRAGTGPPGTEVPDEEYARATGERAGCSAQPQAQRSWVVPVELPVVVELLRAHEQTTAPGALRGIEQGVDRARRESQDAPPQKGVIDLVEHEMARQEAVERLPPRLPARSRAPIDRSRIMTTMGLTPAALM